MQAKTRSAPRTPFGLQSLHPVADASRELAQDLGPVADSALRRARATDEMDTRGESCGFARTAGAQAVSVAIGQEP